MPMKTKQYAPMNSTSKPNDSLARQLFLTANALQSVLAGGSLSDYLNTLAPADKPGIQALSFYVMRKLGFAQEMRKILVPKRPDNKLLEALLLIGLCLLEASLAHAEGVNLETNTPIYQEYTLVDQLVTSASLDKHTKHNKGLINAVLRRYGRERELLLTKLDNKEPAIWNHPNWWIKIIKKSWPNNWQEILSQANSQPPMHLRINRRLTNTNSLLQTLAQADIGVSATGTDSISLQQALPVQKIPGYQAGLWSVQDLSAQRAARLLPVTNQMRVLDACAAPGGKTAHLLELYDIELLALDSNHKRLQRIQENLTRLQLWSDKVTLKCADASDLKQWWDGVKFDAILADVPCTGSGVVRRHPDIRWLRRPKDINQTTSLQANIINSLWQTLKPNGHMLYITCSIFPAEGEQQIQRFINSHPDALRLPAPGQIKPSINHDGFFYALLQKQA